MSPVRMLVRSVPWGTFGLPGEETQEHYVLTEMFPPGEDGGRYLTGYTDGAVLVRDAHGHSVCVLTPHDLRRMLQVMENVGSVTETRGK